MVGWGWGKVLVLLYVGVSLGIMGWNRLSARPEVRCRVVRVAGGRLCKMPILTIFLGWVWGEIWGGGVALMVTTYC